MKDRDSFFKVMVELGMVGEREAFLTRAREMGLPFVDLQRTPIDPEPIHSVTPELARMHHAVPVKRQDNQLWVATVYPNSIQAIDDLSTASKCRIRPVLAVPDEVEAAIQLHYPAEPS